MKDRDRRLEAKLDELIKVQKRAMTAATRLAGRLEALMAQLKNKFDLDSLEAAKIEQQELDEALALAEEQLGTAAEKFETKYGEELDELATED